MNTKLLKEKFEELSRMEDTDDGIFDFKRLLLESDEKKCSGISFFITFKNKR
jgi:hypothetical protein